MTDIAETAVSPPISSLNGGERNAALERRSVLAPEDDHSEASITPVMGTVVSRNPPSAPSAISGVAVAWAINPSRDSGRGPVTVRRWDGTRETAVRIWLESFPSPNTRGAYRRDVTRWLDWCDLYGVPLQDARRGDVDAYRSELEGDEAAPAISTVRRRLAAVSSFYIYWVSEGVLERNPAAHARRPKASRTPGSIALTLAQARQFVDYTDGRADARAALVIRLLLETGMRVSELCGASVGDLEVSSGHRTLMIVRKGGVKAATVLTIRTVQLLEAYLEGRASGPLLITANETALDRAYVRRLVRRLAREAGLPAEVCERMHPHVLRHTAATLLDEAGIPMQRIQRQLGHADIRQTELYAGHRQELEASPVYVLGSLLAA